MKTTFNIGASPIGSQTPLEEYIEPCERKGISNRIKVIADIRETSSKVINELQKLDASIEIKTLDCGDYILSDQVAVERKTSEDFASSIIDGRLFSQAGRLKEHYGKPIIAIEGQSLISYRNIRPEAMAGAVSSLLLDYQIPVVRSVDARETALLLFFIAKREQTIGGGKEPRLRGGKYVPTLKELQEYIVAGLPNIDAKLARRLLKRFKSVENVFTASTNELKEVDGIGEKKSMKIKEILTANYFNDEL